MCEQLTDTCHRIHKCVHNLGSTEPENYGDLIREELWRGIQDYPLVNSVRLYRERPTGPTGKHPITPADRTRVL